MTKIETGDLHTHIFSFSQQEVKQFATLTGDTNPLHLDEEFAAQTQFKKPIIHGMLSASVISKILGTEFPGGGSVYLQQSIEFLRPMYVDKQYELRLVIKEIYTSNHSAIVETTIKDIASKKMTIRGEAMIMNEEYF
ncbi:MAG: MaoC family dehydratase [Bacteroidetes bacterium]|nr:MAG: MaoC family dehydratase [Bacteroidota bacterium]TAG89789.1 MAG: MaoC family dehydratase [Bacteroidota bacterium]